MGDLAEGDVVDGKYRIRRQLGAGGMGALFVADHLFLQKPVALKLLHPELAAQPDAGERFAREARAASLIEHPNVVRVTDFGRAADGRLYLVMELLDGRSLAAELEEASRLGFSRARFVACEVLRGLAAAHARGVVHRDLKPENVFVARHPDGSDAIKLVDFGIARLAVEDAAEARLTKTGAVMGTPLYMAPEQVRGQLDVDARADLYAVGVMLYEMLAGHTPYEGASFGQIAHAVLEGRPRPLGEVAPSADAIFSALVMKSFDADRERRFHSAVEMREALERHRTDEPLGAPSAWASARPSQLRGLPDPDAATVRSARADAAGPPAVSVTDARASSTPAALDASAFGEAAPIALELDRGPAPSSAAPPPAAPRRTLAVILVVAAVALTLTGGAIVLALQRAPASASASAPAAEPPERVQVRIAELPRGARVFLDGAASGPSFTVPGSRQPRRLRLDAPGYATKVLLFTPDSDQIIDGRMTRSR